jgi:hypothetical protein
MFSAAFNNAECLEGSADPKTGSYSFGTHLGLSSPIGTIVVVGLTFVAPET